MTAVLSVAEAVARRRSCRAFLSTPVPVETVVDIVAAACRAPSGANLQPWRVHLLSGATRDALVARVHAAAPDKPFGDGPDYAIQPEQLTPIEKARHEAVAAEMYAAAGVIRDDPASRLGHRMRSWAFFGAPIGLILTIDRRMQPGQWADVGMFAQNIMLLALERGLETCAQQSWALWGETIRDQLGIGGEQLIYGGIAIGYGDVDDRINGFRTDRAPLDEFLTVHR